MTFDALTHGLIAPRFDEEEEHEHTSAPRAPMVDAGKDRLNPEVEYEVLALSGEPNALKTKLNELGTEGWQLVATTPAFIFRRAKKPEEKAQKGRVGFSL